MIKSLEGGRGFAALIVALFHLKIAAPHISLIRNGYLLVDLFFVLSGFLICSAYKNKLENKDAIGPFLLRRFGRLFPLLVFASLVFVLAQAGNVFAKNLLVELGYAKFSTHVGMLPYAIPTAAEIVATLTMTHGMGVFDKLILNYASWSISVEFYTYILFACLCFLLRGRLRLLVFAALGLLAFAVTVWASVDVHQCYLQGHCMDVTFDFGFARCVASFFLGVLTYGLSRSVRFDANLLQGVALGLTLLVFGFVGTLPALAFFCPLLFALLVLSVCGDTGFLAQLFKRAPFQVLGQRSYSIYMMHPVILIAFEPVVKRATGHAFLEAGVLLAYVAVVFLVSGWTYKWIEDPWRIRFNRLALA
ncbi:acyltransferase family protein [Janthinobacterium fluminis]|uniref:Acyltransferase n=1 Tax=Janthinobacterium fluminis TaxID=2987524 RepID=A0ABT5JXY1_9BURK|nr:acyltransferase [Janthinobacterium fluminis]MDC8757595.1 acyltransferase [Janthinobacterium fluminis]